MISIDINKRLNAYNGTLHIAHGFTNGSITKIYGPSGAGKTTLLKMLAGLTRPDSGIITVDGKTWFSSLNNIKLSPQQRRTGFVFQDYALFPNMTVLQHLQYACNDEQWIQRLLYYGQLQTHEKHKPHQLSGGQQQRLALLRALAIKPKVLLMDEPFSALDSDTKTGIISGLKSMVTELKATVLIVSHNLTELHVLEGDTLLINSSNQT